MTPEQLDIESWRPKGDTIVPQHDRARLQRQLGIVWNCMRDGGWRTLLEIAAITGEPEASCSARLRSLRNDFGFTVDRRRRHAAARGIFEYRCTPKDGWA